MRSSGLGKATWEAAVGHHTSNRYRAWRPLWLDSSLATQLQLPVTLKASSSDGTTPSISRMRHNVGIRIRRTRPSGGTLKSPHKPEEIDVKTW